MSEIVISEVLTLFVVLSPRGAPPEREVSIDRNIRFKTSVRPDSDSVDIQCSSIHNS